MYFCTQQKVQEKRRSARGKFFGLGSGDLGNVLWRILTAPPPPSFQNTDLQDLQRYKKKENENKAFNGTFSWQMNTWFPYPILFLQNTNLLSDWKDWIQNKKTQNNKNTKYDKYRQIIANTRSNQHKNIKYKQHNCKKSTCQYPKEIINNIDKMITDGTLSI